MVSARTYDLGSELLSKPFRKHSHMGRNTSANKAMENYKWQRWISSFSTNYKRVK